MKRAPLCPQVDQAPDDFKPRYCRTHDDFEDEISRFEGYVHDAAVNLLYINGQKSKNIRGCIKGLLGERDAGEKRIRKANNDIARWKTMIIDATIRLKPDKAKAKVLHKKIKRAESDIEKTARMMAECIASIIECMTLSDLWKEALKKRRAHLAFLKSEDKRGRDSHGLALECGEETSKKEPCEKAKLYGNDNWAKFRKGIWGPCRYHN